MIPAKPTMSPNTEPRSPDPRHVKAANRRLAIWLLGATCMMFGFGYALVPIYNVLCQVTGLNGKTDDKAAVVTTAPEVDTSRTIRIEFVTNTDTTMPWEFAPVEAEITVHPGELKTVNFAARNPATFPVTGQAVPSVAPGSAARYFKKTECFCFTRQTLAGGESKMMPVRFIVDPRLPEHIDVLTLSYTFFEVEDEVAANIKTINGGRS